MVFAGSPHRLAFSKFQGLGNDFLLLDCRESGDLRPLLARLQAAAPSICHRGKGVGADGILVVTPSDNPECRATMVVINADGSRPEMCGNGLRCVAHMLGHSQTSASTFRVHTDKGPLRCSVQPQSGNQVLVSVDMGPAEFGQDQRPQAAPDRVFHSVSMGNPHAIHWVASGECPQDLAQRLGPKVERDPAYPQRTNVEFVQDTPSALVTWVWERGCGITQACGTGACATAAAAVRHGHRPADAPIRVTLPGGDLEIVVPQDPAGSIVMRGPSQWVFDGYLGDVLGA